MTVAHPDVIDLLVGIAPGSVLDGIRAQRQQARDNAQASYLALFKPDDPGDVTIGERYALAVFIAGLHRQPAIGAFYGDELARLAPDLVAPLGAEIVRAAAEGPYGYYPDGPLSGENREGPIYAVADAQAALLGARLTAAMQHIHMLVFHPRDAAPEALEALQDAGWSTTGIVTISQLAAFLSFQIRVVSGLRTLAAV